jgi:hypothetical protein
MLKKEQINPDIPVRIKFAFDGARITLKQKQTQVVGTSTKGEWSPAGAEASVSVDTKKGSIKSILTLCAICPCWLRSLVSILLVTQNPSFVVLTAWYNQPSFMTGALKNGQCDH